MSMSHEELEKYLSQRDNNSQVEEKEPSTNASTTESATPVESAEKTDSQAGEDSPSKEEPENGGPDHEDKVEEVKGSDEPEKSSVPEKKDTEKNDKPQEFDPAKELTKSQYAFIREKQKRKDQKARYEAKIKELEEELEKTKGLLPEHFKKNDGSEDTKAYVDWREKRRDMEEEVQSLRARDAKEQQEFDLAEDRRRVDNCFPDEKERSAYDELISKKGQAFYDAVSEVDKDQVVFNYLSTMAEYPIVLRELMTNPKTLSRVFRSTDNSSLKKNIADISDEILDRIHSATDKTETSSIDATKVQTQTTTPVQEKKIPIIGKQMNNSSGPTVGDKLNGRADWNSWLLKHPRSR